MSQLQHSTLHPTQTLLREPAEADTAMKSSHHLEAVEDQGHLWRATLRKHNDHPSFQKIVKSEDIPSLEGIQGLIWIEQLLHLIKALWQREDEEKKRIWGWAKGDIYTFWRRGVCTVWIWIMTRSGDMERWVIDA